MQTLMLVWFIGRFGMRESLTLLLGIFFSKDRREEVIEVEEEPETVFVPDADEQAKIMTQGQWMKGCPEGGEQSFLFSLYQELTDGECRCPNGCQKTVTRQKRDFFPIFVSACDAYTTRVTTLLTSRFFSV